MSFSLFLGLLHERGIFLLDVDALGAHVIVSDFGQNLFDRMELVFEFPFREHHHRDFLVVVRQLHALVDLQLMPNSQTALNQFEFALFFHIR